MKMNKVNETLDYIYNTIDIGDIRLSEGYYYNSIVFCIIDAVYSIGARYASTKKTVERYCLKNGLKMYRRYGSLPIDIKDEHRVEDFLRILEGLTYLEMAEDLFENRQRTSTRNGILKAQAVCEFANILYDNDINSFSDIPKLYDDINIQNQIKSIKGQGSGISLNYFFMLTGDDNKVKPDRHIINFLEEATGKTLSKIEIEELFKSCVDILRERNPNITCRSLDHAIWGYMSNR